MSNLISHAVKNQIVQLNEFCVNRISEKDYMRWSKMNNIGQKKGLHMSYWELLGKHETRFGLQGLNAEYMWPELQGYSYCDEKMWCTDNRLRQKTGRKLSIIARLLEWCFTSHAMRRSLHFKNSLNFNPHKKLVTQDSFNICFQKRELLLTT